MQIKPIMIIPTCCQSIIIPVELLVVSFLLLFPLVVVGLEEDDPDVVDSPSFFCTLRRILSWFIAVAVVLYKIPLWLMFSCLSEKGIDGERQRQMRDCSLTLNSSLSSGCPFFSLSLFVTIVVVRRSRFPV